MGMQFMVLYLSNTSVLENYHDSCNELTNTAKFKQYGRHLTDNVFQINFIKMCSLGFK